MHEKPWIGERYAVIGVQLTSDNHLRGYQFLRNTPYASIAVLLNRPAHLLSDILERKGISTQRLSFVDHVSKVIDSPFEHQHALYSTGPYTLHKTLTLLSQFVAQGNKERKIVVFDALHDLHHYYDANTIVRAIDHFVDATRSLHLSPVFLFDRAKTSKGVAQKLRHVCDKIIKIPS